MIALLLVSLLAALPDSTDRPVMPPAGTQTVYAEAVEELGLFRLSDLLLLADGWSVHSFDGFTWIASPIGSPFLSSTSTLVLVDGHRFVPGMGRYATDLDRLPLSLAQVDSVEFLSGPSARPGFRVHGGTVRMHTRPLRPGFSVRARGLLGNRAGDPGPHFYTDFPVANVDKTGPHIAVDTGYRNGRFSLAATSQYQRQFVEDLMIRGAFDAIGDYPEHRLLNAGVRTGFTSAALSSELIFSATDTKDYALHRAVTPFRIDARSYTASLAGSVRAASHLFEYQAAYRHESLEEDFIDTLNFSGESRLAFALVAWSHPAGNGAVGVEGWIQDERLIRLRPSMQFSGRSARVTARWDAARGRSLQSFSVSGGVLRSEPHFGVYAGNEWRPSGRLRISTEAAAAHNVGADLLSFEDETRDPILQPSLDPRSYLTASEIGARFGLTASVWEGFTVRLSQQADYVAVRSMPGGAPGADPVVASSGGFASTSIIRAALRPNRMTDHVLSYRFFFAPRPDEAYAAPLGTPQHRVQYRISFRPVAGFSLAANAVYESAVTWSALHFPGFEEGSAGLRQEAALFINASAQKWFWNERLRGGILIRNVLDADKKYHPGGKTINLGLFVQAGLAL